MPKRRRGTQSRRLQQRITAGSPAGRYHPFEALVERALATIPDPFASALDEVAVVIEDEPSLEQLRESGLDEDETLYGLYQGVPRTAWGAGSVPIPNKISLFRLPLEADYPDPDDLAEEVRLTVVHELAHHLGIDDDRLDELGV